MAGACWRDFGGIPRQYMSEFMKRVSILGQNVRACLPGIAGREALAVLEKPGGLPSRRVEANSPCSWLPAVTEWGPQALSPGGSGDSKRGAVSVSKTACFLCRKASVNHALQV